VNQKVTRKITKKSAEKDSLFKISLNVNNSNQVKIKKEGRHTAGRPSYKLTKLN
jgi:hypothetical protein